MKRAPFFQNGWLAVSPVLMCLTVPSLAQVTEVPLLFVGPADSSAYRGAQQGLAEAQAQGEFLGQHYTLAVQAAPSATPVSAAAVIAAVDPAGLRVLAAANPGLPILEVSLSDDALRRQCRPHVLFVLPSAAMQVAAVAQWQTANPTAVGVTAQAWHPSLEKYAAAQLNKRYRGAFAHAMDDQAWAGWAAVKLLSDTVAREESAAPAVLLEALRTRLAFDGQKGVDMSFRADGQLRQPLVLIAEGKLIGEAPVRGVAEVEDLDSLGRSECAE